MSLQVQLSLLDREQRWLLSQWLQSDRDGGKNIRPPASGRVSEIRARAAQLNRDIIKVLAGNGVQVFRKAKRWRAIMPTDVNEPAVGIGVTPMEAAVDLLHSLKSGR
jgi:hypothetical protein